MTLLQLGPDNALDHTHQARNRINALSFFQRPDVGTKAGALIAPCIRQAGHSVLVFDFQGQTNSPFCSRKR